MRPGNGAQAPRFDLPWNRRSSYYHTKLRGYPGNCVLFWLNTRRSMEEEGSIVKTFNRLLIAYTAWLCRTFGVGPAQIDRARVRSYDGFAPRPEGARGFYY